MVLIFQNDLNKLVFAKFVYNESVINHFSFGKEDANCYLVERGKHGRYLLRNGNESESAL